MENLVYTLVQIGHNFGAAAVVGGPIAGWWLERQKLSTRFIAMIAFAGWFVQGATGIGFAATSYFLKGALPEVAGIALAAVAIKTACTIAGCIATAMVWRKQNRLSMKTKQILWLGSMTGAFVALTAAAVLRWYL